MPTTAPDVAVIVLLLPAEVGVSAGNVLSTPAVNAAEVPVAPAVPPKLTVPVKRLGPVLSVLPLASLAVMLTMLPLTDAGAGRACCLGTRDGGEGEVSQRPRVHRRDTRYANHST